MAKNAIVFVHGRGKKPSLPAYRQMWLDALATRVAPEFRSALLEVGAMAYYADVFCAPESVGAGVREPDKGSIVDALLRVFKPAPESSPPPETQDSPSRFIEGVLKYFAWDYDGVVAKPVVAALDRATAGSDNVMVISHSMGTMVMYDVLAEHPYHIDTWITLGSPLGFTQDIWAQVPAHLIALTRDRGDLLGIVDRTVRGILEGALTDPQRPVGGPATRR